MNLNDWAKYYNIPQAALDDLLRRVTCSSPPVNDTNYSEADVQNIRRIEASKKGGVLWRNNVGAFIAPNGSMVRYGLANDSKKVNKLTKSSDLIGITPLLITQNHVGQVKGIFTSEECKRSNWKYTGTPQELAQLNYMTIVIALGGYARFSTG